MGRWRVFFLLLLLLPLVFMSEFVLELPKIFAKIFLLHGPLVVRLLSQLSAITFG